MGTAHIVIKGQLIFVSFDTVDKIQIPYEIKSQIKLPLKTLANFRGRNQYIKSIFLLLRYLGSLMRIAFPSSSSQRQELHDKLKLKLLEPLRPNKRDQLCGDHHHYQHNYPYLHVYYDFHSLT